MHPNIMMESMMFVENCFTYFCRGWVQRNRGGGGTVAPPKF